MKLSTAISESGIPALIIEAENVSEKQRLRRLKAELHNVQLQAIREGMADRHNVCGSCGDVEGIMSLHLSLLLGGHPHHIVWPEDSDGQAKVTISIKGTPGEVSGRFSDFIKGLLKGKVHIE